MSHQQRRSFFGGDGTLTTERTPPPPWFEKAATIGNCTGQYYHQTAEEEELRHGWNIRFSDSSAHNNIVAANSLLFAGKDGLEDRYVNTWQDSCS